MSMSAGARAALTMLVVVAGLAGSPAWLVAGVRTVTDSGDTGQPGQLRTEITLAQAGDVILVARPTS
jgi:hypothetical protein